MQKIACYKLDLTLLVASLVYIILPYFFFFIGWFKPIYSILYVILLLVAMYAVIRDCKYIPKDSRQIKIPIGKIILLCTLIFVWVALSGSGQVFGFQNGDYFKHNATLRDLITHSWPVFYDQDRSLIYYLAYYLPVAAVGKILDWKAANLFLFLWTYLGVLLSFLWFSKLINKLSAFLLIFFIFFGGLDFLGVVYYQTPQNPFPHFTQNHIEWWATVWQYSSNTTSLFWVPQHVIPGWILAGIIMYFFKTEYMIKHIPFIAVLSIFWSPFITIGFFVFAAYAFFSKIKDQININTFVVAPIIFFTFVFYYLNGYLSAPSNETAYFIDLKKLWLDMFIFEFLEFGLYACIAFFLIKNINEKKWSIDSITLLSLLFLIVLPVYHLGEWNDIVMRSSIPALFFIQIFLAKKLVLPCESETGKYILISLLSIGAIVPIMEMNRGYQNRGQVSDIESLEAMGHFFAQYVGTEKNFIYDFLKPRSNVGSISH